MEASEADVGLLRAQKDSKHRFIRAGNGIGNGSRDYIERCINVVINHCCACLCGNLHLWGVVFVNLWKEREREPRRTKSEHEGMVVLT